MQKDQQKSPQQTLEELRAALVEMLGKRDGDELAALEEIIAMARIGLQYPALAPEALLKIGSGIDKGLENQETSVSLIGKDYTEAQLDVLVVQAPEKIKEWVRDACRTSVHREQFPKIVQDLLRRHVYLQGDQERDKAFFQAVLASTSYEELRDKHGILIGGMGPKYFQTLKDALKIGLEKSPNSSITVTSVDLYLALGRKPHIMRRLNDSHWFDSDVTSANNFEGGIFDQGMLGILLKGYLETGSSRWGRRGLDTMKEIFTAIPKMSPESAQVLCDAFDQIFEQRGLKPDSHITS